MTITGNNFSGVNSVKFTNNVSAQFTVNSNTQITATVPNGAATGSIVIGKPGCNNVQTGVFTVNAPQISVTVGTNPAGGSFIVDGTTYTTTQTFNNWISGSSHSIETKSPQTDDNTRYNFTNWSDGNTQISRTVSPTTNTTYLANFTTQYYLTMNAGAGGTVSPTSNWHNAGNPVQISATANSGYNFSSWSGSGSDSYSGTNSSATVTMNSPITQTANFTQVQCNYSISPTSQTFNSNAGNGSVSVTTTNGCNWTAISNDTWITITGGSSESGNGTVTYSVQQNTSSTQRQGTMTIAGKTFTVTQNGQQSTCNYSINPTSRNFDANSGTGNLTVNATAGCAWTATAYSSVLRGIPNKYENNFSIFNEESLFAKSYTDATQKLFDYMEAPPGWIIITSGSSGNGNGVINYSVDQNSLEFRVGTITITANGETQATHTVNQSAPNPTAVRKPFDFDGDGKADVSVFRPSNGAWYLQQSAQGFTGFSFGQNGDKIIPADYDGDGKTDIAVYRNGIWYLQRSQLGFTGIPFGDGNDIPVPADYDGDGKADIAVFRPSNGVWYLQRSLLGFTGIAFGQIGDKPVAADYDGDGKADMAVFRNGTWYLQRSQLGFTGVQFGEATDKPVPADYDGDGKADVAVFRPSNGTWYLQRSQFGFTGVAFGISTDLPVPADYDGDGKTDIAVFRNGTWYLQRSTQGFTGAAFGAATDKPIPNAFVP